LHEKDQIYFHIVSNLKLNKYAYNTISNLKLYENKFDFFHTISNLKLYLYMYVYSLMFKLYVVKKEILLLFLTLTTKPSPKN
jgi:hypothetical protein